MSSKETLRDRAIAAYLGRKLTKVKKFKKGDVVSLLSGFSYRLSDLGIVDSDTEHNGMTLVHWKYGSISSIHSSSLIKIGRARRRA